MKTKIVAGAMVLLAVVGYFVAGGVNKANAQPYSRACIVPKSYAEIKGSMFNGNVSAIMFEDGSGVMRFVDTSQCAQGRPVVILEIHRQ